MRMGDTLNVGIDAIPTGALALDMALGIGGLPRGRVVEIYGPESSGKSTLAMHVVAENERVRELEAENAKLKDQLVSKAEARLALKRQRQENAAKARERARQEREARKALSSGQS